MTTKTTRERAEESGAKLPADHAVEQEANGGPTTVEVDGFTLTFDPADVTDFRLQKRMMRQDGAAVLDMIELVLGDQEEAVVDSLENESGHVDTETVMQFVNRALEAAGLGKPSASPRS